MQQKISQQEALLRSTKKDVRSQLNDLALITGQIDERKNYIHTIEGDVNILTADIADLQKQFLTAFANMGVYIDGNALVGAIGNNMDRELGRIANRAGRWA